MDEARRLAYLNAMGIDCYVRREPRPAVAAAIVEQRSASVVPDAPSKMSKLKSDLAETLPGKTAVSKRRDVSVASASEADSLAKETELERAAEQLRFSLQYYRISERFVVINEVPYLGNERTGKEVNSLLRAILRALGQDLAELPSAARFNWPLNPDDDASQTLAAEAYQALQGFMGKRLHANGNDLVLVFGSQCEDLFASSGLAQLLAESSKRLVHTHSLDAMLQVPVLKRSVWETIRVLPELIE